MSSKTVRNIREPLKKPRPLKSVGSSDQLKFHIQDPKETVIQKSKEDILSDLEILNVSISNCNFDEVTAADISRMCAILKKRGEELDKFNKEAIDRYFCTLRNASREERLDMVSRLKLLEVIELRANGWKKNDNIQNYFNSKIQDLEQGIQEMSISTSTSLTSVPFAVQNQNVPVVSSVPLAPGEILRSSGKFSKPTKIAGKNVFKDEILIRNSDSGKVNPGARDRLVQITGPHEEAIGHAKILVEDTIRRNASPIRDNLEMGVLDNEKESLEFSNSYSQLDNQMFMKKSLQHSYSMSDASLREQSVSVSIDQDVIRLCGTNSELLKTARMVLLQYFAAKNELHDKHYEPLTSLNRQSPDRNKPRYELRKQPSLKSTMEVMHPSNFLSQTGKRDSLSPFSSDDDFLKEEKNEELLKSETLHSFTTQTSLPEIKRRAISLGSTHAPDFLTRRSSVPSDFEKGFIEVNQPVNEEVFSPNALSSPEDAIMMIPPPTYKRKCYSRETLLDLAESPLSHNQPADYALMHQNFQEILCESPVMFNPQKFREKEFESEKPV